MPGRRPEDSQLSAAFRAAYELAGVSQIQIAEALDVDQPTVSKWARGERPPPLWALPVIDRLCRRPVGDILRRAGLVEDGGDVVTVINGDPHLDEGSKVALAKLYDNFVRLTASSSSV